MKSLRIHRYVTPETDVETFDFSLLNSIKKISPSYDKGRKTKSKYLGEDDEIVVEKVFEDIVEDGKLVALGMTINWFNQEKDEDDNDVVGFSKYQVVKRFNFAERSTFLRKRRSRVIDWLQASAVGTPIESFVNALLKHFKTEVDLFIYNNTDDFLTGVANEPQTIKDENGNDVLDGDGNPQPNPFYAYLQIVIEAPSDEYPTGKKVRDSINEQIS